MPARSCDHSAKLLAISSYKCAGYLVGHDTRFARAAALTSRVVEENITKDLHRLMQSRNCKNVGVNDSAYQHAVSRDTLEASPIAARGRVETPVLDVQPPIFEANVCFVLKFLCIRCTFMDLFIFTSFISIAAAASLVGDSIGVFV